MKTETASPGSRSFEDQGSASKPLSFHPLRTAAAVAALLKVKPEPKAK